MTEQQRIAAALDAAEAGGASALLLTRLVDVRYLTGFTGSNAAALISADGRWLATDGRYAAQAALDCPEFETVESRQLVDALLAAAPLAKGAALGFDPAGLSMAAGSSLEARLRELGLVGVQLPGLCEELRMVKDGAEVAALQEACDITVSSWQSLLAEGVLGRTEAELAGRLEHLFRLNGADDRAFPSIVAAGSNSATPHHQPTSRAVAQGDLLKIDCGARVRGYHADFTRTVVVGTPADWQVELHEVVRSAQALGRAHAVEGTEAMALDHLVRSEVEGAGYGAEFVHPLGHGVGLEIHERPFLGREGTILRPHMALTVEPGVYLAGRGGVRIEDTLLLSDGGPINMTDAEHGLISL